MRRLYGITIFLALMLGLVVGIHGTATIAWADPAPGFRVQIPRIDSREGWQTQIHVENMGNEDTAAVLLLWSPYSGTCSPNDLGPVIAQCSPVIPPGGGSFVWVLENVVLNPHSAIVYAVEPDRLTGIDGACEEALNALGDTFDWQEWEEEWEVGTGVDSGGDPLSFGDPGGALGEQIAVTVTRRKTDAQGTTVASVYPGISEKMEGTGPPFGYYTSLNIKNWPTVSALGVWNTEASLQNSGIECVEADIHYQQQGTCADTGPEQNIFNLAPGEAFRTEVPDSFPDDWLGSAFIGSSQPLGIVVDQKGRDMLLTHRGRSSKPEDGNMNFFVPLIYREFNGWESSIQVQNLNPAPQPTFVITEFFDNSGGSVLFLADWICDDGALTFYLPAITDLPWNYSGAATVESHNQISVGGGDVPGRPVQAIVNLQNDTRGQGLSYNAVPQNEVEGTTTIGLPFIAKRNAQGWTSEIAVRNNANCNKIQMELTVRDVNNTTVAFVESFWLHPHQVKVLDMAQIGTQVASLTGSGILRVIGVEQLCRNRLETTKPAAVVVNRYNGSAGDLSTGYAGVPLARQIQLETKLLGRAAWTDNRVCEGLFSALLHAPAVGPGNEARGRIDLNRPIALKDLDDLQYILNAGRGLPAHADLYIDVNGDGVWEDSIDDVLIWEPYQWQDVYDARAFGGVNFAQPIEATGVPSQDPNSPNWIPAGDRRGSPIWSTGTAGDFKGNDNRCLTVNLADNTVLWSETAFDEGHALGGSFGIDDILFPWAADEDPDGDGITTEDGNWKTGTVPTITVDPEGQGDPFNPNPKGITADSEILRIEFEVDNSVYGSRSFLDDVTIDGTVYTVD